MRKNEHLNDPKKRTFKTQKKRTFELKKKRTFELKKKRTFELKKKRTFELRAARCSGNWHHFCSPSPTHNVENVGAVRCSENWHHARWGVKKPARWQAWCEV
jgi:hypothetical protein